MRRLLNLIKFKPSTIMFLVMGSLVGALFFKAVAKDPGYVLLAHGRHTIETSLLVGILFTVFSCFLLYWAWSLLRWAFDPQRGRRSANRRTTQGLVAMAQGDWSTAEKLLAKSARNNEMPLINYLSAAQAAQELGNTDQRDEYLRLAHDHEAGKGLDAAVGLTKARFEYQGGQWEDCLASLMKLSKNQKSPSYAYVIKMLSKVYAELEDWDKLTALIPLLKKNKVMDAEEIIRLNRLCYEGQVKRADRGDTDDAKYISLQEAWRQIPHKFHFEPSLVHIYALSLVKVQAEKDAERVIAAALDKNWDDTLVQLYGTVAGADLEQQLSKCDSWLIQHPNNAMLLLSLGRISLQMTQWDKAKSFFEASLRSRKSAQAFGELGRLLSYLGDHQASNEYFESGLALIAERLPDLPLPEEKEVPGVVASGS